MPPRFTYWTIIFGGQSTAFRSGTREELLPTFKQIQAKHPDAQLRFFARGKLWYSEDEAQAAQVRERFERRPPAGRRPLDAPRRDDRRAEGGDRRPWTPKPADGERKAWTPKPQDGERKSWTPKPQDGERKPWTPKSRDGERKPWTPKPRDGERKPWTPKPRDGERKPWTPKPRDGERRAEDPRAPAGERRRGRDWRPGGDHKDPRARFKIPRDVKRAGMAKKFGWKKKKDDE
jgi:hypothetical protein